MSDTKTYPELIFGLVGPIGCSIREVENALADALKEVDYSPHFISLSESIADLMELKNGERPELVTLEQKIDAGNSVRKSFGKNGILAVDAVRKVRAARAVEHERRKTELPIENGEQVAGKDFPASRTAYIVRQLKNRDELVLLRDIYGKQFVQVSITQDKSSRIEAIVQRSRTELPDLDNDAAEELARRQRWIDLSEQVPGVF